MDNKVKTSALQSVLLLGSGLDQAYGGLSWNAFLKAIAAEEYADEQTIRELKCAEPLKAILITNDTVDKSLKAKRKILMQTVHDENYMAVLQSILKMGFDDILTTNYTYELESVALHPKKINDKNVRTLRRYLIKEERYHLHTYNEVNLGEHQNKVWHVHGEAACPSGMILGHYFYGNLLSKIHAYVKDPSNYFKNIQAENQKNQTESWIDSFIKGDIYVVGFGFGLSELDFWWLLNRKAREKEENGKVYFYEPAPVTAPGEKRMLLQTLKNSRGEKMVEIIDFGFKNIIKDDKAVFDGDWKEFYQCVIEDIRKKMKNKNEGEMKNVQICN